jgi:hypothetical protein
VRGAPLVYVFVFAEFAPGAQEWFRSDSESPVLELSLRVMGVGVSDFLILFGLFRVSDARGVGSLRAS